MRVFNTCEEVAQQDAGRQRCRSALQPALQSGATAGRVVRLYYLLFATALLLFYYCFTTALLLLCYCFTTEALREHAAPSICHFTTALLLLYYFTAALLLLCYLSMQQPAAGRVVSAHGVKQL